MDASGPEREKCESHGCEYVIDQDPERVRLATRSGYLALRGDVTDNALLERVGIRNRVHTLICVTGDDVKKVSLTLSARRLNDGLRIISRAGKKVLVIGPSASIERLKQDLCN